MVAGGELIETLRINPKRQARYTMTSQETTTTPTTTTAPRSHATRRHGRRYFELRAAAKASSSPAEPDLETRPSPATARTPAARGGESTLRSAGRFLALAANPFRLKMAALGALLTVIVGGGIWAVLSWVIAPATRHMDVKTPFGMHSVTVAISRWPWAIAFACVIGGVLILIAGIRLQRLHDQRA
jgi:hypothetical protein